MTPDVHAGLYPNESPAGLAYDRGTGAAFGNDVYVVVGPSGAGTSFRSPLRRPLAGPVPPGKLQAEVALRADPVEGEAPMAPATPKSRRTWRRRAQGGVRERRARRKEA